MLREIKEALSKIKYVFTEEYRRECEYIEFEKSMRDRMLKEAENKKSTYNYVPKMESIICYL